MNNPPGFRSPKTLSMAHRRQTFSKTSEEIIKSFGPPEAGIDFSRYIQSGLARQATILVIRFFRKSRYVVFQIGHSQSTQVATIWKLWAMTCFDGRGKDLDDFVQAQSRLRCQ